MLYVTEDIPSKLLSIENQPTEGFYINKFQEEEMADLCYI